MTDFILHPFPGQSSGGVTIKGDLTRTQQTIVLSFVLQGNLGDIVLPAATTQRRDDNLWQATCLEMFWAEEGRKNYWELNLAPNGAWNVYAFADYRAEMRREERIAKPLTETTRTEESFALTAELEIGNLHGNNTPLRVGITAVLQHRDNRLSYWALAHPENKPDFHAPETFLLRM